MPKDCRIGGYYHESSGEDLYIDKITLHAVVPSSELLVSGL